MKLIEFPEQNMVFAKDQPEYMPLPALKLGGIDGEIICCWKLSWTERLQVLVFGRVWHSILTFNRPLQPQLLEATTPEAVLEAKRVKA